MVTIPPVLIPSHDVIKAKIIQWLVSTFTTGDVEVVSEDPRLTTKTVVI